MMRLNGVLANALAGALSRLDERISAVSWPSGSLSAGLTNSPLGARAVTTPASLKNDLSASLNPEAQSSSENRLQTRAQNALALSGLSAGTYGLRLSLGGATEKLSVTLEAGSTVGQVFAAVADAVNASSLAVGASVGKNTFGLSNGASALSLTTDASQAAQRVALSDTANIFGATGRLASWLGLSASRAAEASASGAASIGTTHVTALSAAKPSVYSSYGFDPNALATLAPGTYTLDYLVGPTSVGGGAGGTSGSVEITVSSGDTWRDVLSRMSRVLGSASSAMLSRLVPAKRVWDSTTDESHSLVDAVGLEVRSNTVKEGWGLTLKGADAASETMLHALGLGSTAQPGSTARAVIDGVARTSATGTFSADSGRVTLHVGGTFGEVAPVRVSAPLTDLTDALAEVLAAYNEVTDVLTQNAAAVKPGVAQHWTSLASDRAASLSAVGVERTGQSLWLSEEAFLTALLAQPEQVKETLSGAEGLLPAVQQSAAGVLSGGVETWLSPQAQATAKGMDLFTVSLAARTEVEVEKASQLLDLYDSQKDFGLNGAAGLGGRFLVRQKG